jgi:hypothetical protein
MFICNRCVNGGVRPSAPTGSSQPFLAAGFFHSISRIHKMYYQELFEHDVSVSVLILFATSQGFSN